MKKFKFTSNDLAYELTLGECFKYNAIPKFEVIELKKDNNTIYKNETCTISFTTGLPGISLKFKDRKLLDITNQQDILFYLYSISKFDYLYDYIISNTSYTLEFFYKLKEC